MTDRCAWCGNDILDWHHATVFLRKSWHKRCLKGFKTAFKREFKIDIDRLAGGSMNER